MNEKVSNPHRLLQYPFSLNGAEISGTRLSRWTRADFLILPSLPFFARQCFDKCVPKPGALLTRSEEVSGIPRQYPANTSAPGRCANRLKGNKSSSPPSRLPFPSFHSLLRDASPSAWSVTWRSVILLYLRPDAFLRTDPSSPFAGLFVALFALPRVCLSPR
jgi:hypothetical protein